MKRVEIPSIIVVVWVDTQTTLGWHVDPDSLNPAVVISCGFLIKEDKKYLKVAGTWTDINFADGTVIPKGNIIYREELVPRKTIKWFNRKEE